MSRDYAESAHETVPLDNTPIPLDEGGCTTLKDSSVDLQAGKTESHASAAFQVHKVPILLALGVLVLDHATKLWAIRALRGLDSATGSIRKIVIVPDCFDLSYAENTGAAFSLFSSHPELLTLVSLGIAGLIFWWYWHTPRGHRGTRMALALVLGGAVGNLIDRFFRGAVVDFIHVFWRQYHWPTFNVADSAICVGIGLLILWSFREQKTPCGCPTP